MYFYSNNCQSLFYKPNSLYNINAFIWPLQQGFFFFWNQSIKLWFDFLPVNNTAEMYVLYKALTFLQFLLD